MTSVCSFQDFKEFFNNVIDGKIHKFLLIDRMQMPIQMRLNWNIIGDAKQMVQTWLKEIRLRQNNTTNTIEKPIKSILKKRTLQTNDSNIFIKKIKY